MTLQIATLRDVRAFIADAILGKVEQSGKIGSVTLQSHQLEAIARAQKSLTEFRGVLLADPVGTGKTYVALAIADGDGTVVTIGPAVLREMWESSASRCGRTLRYISFESLSRGKEYVIDADTVIVDEAHHVRNPSTRRHSAIASLVSEKPVVLISATPIHNRRADLVAQLSLFMGSRAEGLSDAELARVVIRRSSLTHTVAGVPRTANPQWIDIDVDNRIPPLLMALPPPLPVSDGGDGGALVVHSLLRQWMSTDAALAGALKRRRVRAEALIAALENETWPTASEMSSWLCGDDAVQLALPGFLGGPTPLARTLLPVVTRHRDALLDATAAVRSSSSDVKRARSIANLIVGFPERKIVVFSQFADSVEGLFAHLAPGGRVAVLTGSGGRVSSGPMTRQEVIQRFAPLANGAAPPRRAEDIRILLTTDILSEGVNLQDAGIVVHLDFPWTPARMEQRVGRIARMGSPHAEVLSLAFRPPASAEAIVKIEKILRRKMQDAGIVTETIPSLSVLCEDARISNNPSSLNEEIRRYLTSWNVETSDIDQESCLVAAVSGDEPGFVGIAEVDGEFSLVSANASRISDDPLGVLSSLRACNGVETPVDREQARAAFERFSAWLNAAASLSGVRPSKSYRDTQRQLVNRIDRIFRRTPRPSRPLVAARAALARALLLEPIDAHGERQLAALHDVEDERLIESIVHLRSGRRISATRAASPRALILFRR